MLSPLAKAWGGSFFIENLTEGCANYILKPKGEIYEKRT